MTLAGRTVLVTGANRGLGAHFVRAALDRGAGRVYAAAREPGAVAATARVEAVQLDLAEPERIEALARLDVDLLVSNAGVSCYGPALADDEGPLRRALEVNALGPLRLVRALRPSGVVFVLSVAAVALSRSSPGYSASKAAGLMTALGVREEMPETQVTVALPGFVDTEMSAPLAMPKADPADVAARTLDAWLAGQNTVWPDAFAEQVRDAVGPEFLRLLDRPRDVMTAIQEAYRPTTA